MLGIQKARRDLSTLVLEAATDLKVTVISVSGHARAAIVPVDRHGVAFVPPPARKRDQVGSGTLADAIVEHHNEKHTGEGSADG